MKKLIIFLLLFNFLSAMPQLPNRITIILNKNGISLKDIPKYTKIDDIDVSSYKNTIFLKSNTSTLTSTLDLRRFIHSKECIKDWESCNNNRKDEMLMVRLNEFYRDIGNCEEDDPSENICPKVDKDIRKWRVFWERSWLFRANADICQDNEFCFLSNKDAIDTLKKINAILHKHHIDASFPTNYLHNKRYSHLTLSFFPDAKYKVKEVLTKLKKDGYLIGLSSRDINQISSIAKGGKAILYIPKKCLPLKDPYRFTPLKSGWNAIDNNARISFDSNGCPRFQALK